MTNHPDQRHDTPRTVDLPVVWRGERLAGTLHLPAGRGQHPLVLMMQGSGPTDRDCEGYFEPIRDAFMARGFAAYSFDKPGCGESTGEWRRHGLFDRGDQVAAVLAELRARPEIDASRTGVWGQSQGGWLAQLVAAEVPELAFSISNSGPTIGVREQDLYGCEHTLRAQGVAEPEIARALEFMRSVHDFAARGVAWEVVEAEVLAAGRDSESARAYVDLDDGDPSLDYGLGQIFLQEAYDPLEALERAHCPFLAVYGGLDVLLPAWRSAREAGDALHAAGNTDATVVVFPNGDHRIRGASGEFVPGYLDLIAGWAAARAGLGGA